MNPHDITDFPYSFALANGGSDYGNSTNPHHTGFLPPPTYEYDCAYPGCAANQWEATDIQALTARRYALHNKRRLLAALGLELR